MMATSRIRSRRAALTLAVVALIALLCAANMHLVYVSLVSQPDCVPHRRIGEHQAHAGFAAAVSSCSPSFLAETARSDR